MLDPKKCTTKALKEALASLDLPTTGNKAELLLRLTRAEGFDMSTLEGSDGHTETNQDENDDEGAASMQCMLELYKKEKELAEREVALLRRELEMAQRRQTDDEARGATSAEQRPAVTSSRTVVHNDQGPTRVSLSMLADLLSFFDGNNEAYERWERQVLFLKEAYRLDEDSTKILIGMRLKERALEWFHSKPEHIQMATGELLRELRGMFFQRPNKIAVRRRFEERTWKKTETFNDYAHEKTILANQLGLPEEEILQYIVDGIPDANLRDAARIHGFTTKAGLLQAFEEITLRDRSDTTRSTAKSENKQSATKTPAKSESNRSSERRETVPSVNKKDRAVAQRCFNCGERDHVSPKCPSKELGRKCFKCEKFGHIAAACPGASETKKACVLADTSAKNQKQAKRVVVNGMIVDAIIDTASDLTIIREDQYDDLGKPKLVGEPTPFRGVGKEVNKTVGFFNATMKIDEHEYEVRLYVVKKELLDHKLLIGTDFLDCVKLFRSRGICKIEPLNDVNDESASVPEVLRIQAIELNDSDTADLSNVCVNENREKIARMIKEYKPERRREVGVCMTIVLKDDVPIYQRARRLGEAEKREVNEQIQEWMKDGIVRESHSDYASPIVVVKKKDGSNRLCVDYRLLNQKIIKDRYPLPLIEDQLDLLQGAKVFTTLDLRNGFFHVQVEEASRKYTSFIVPDGQYEFCRVPFGLCNSPAVFQKFVNAVFRELIKERVVLTYMDDLIIPSKDDASGIENLERVFQVASEADLIFKWSKCNFLQREVEFLGHVIGQGQVRPSERKTEAVRKFPELTNIKQVQAFLGLTGYFRKFIPKYSLIARPLTNLLRNGVEFRFEDDERNAFENLKIALTTRPVLNLYKTNAETELHTDASKHGYGAVLIQKNVDDDKWHPVYFASGKTTAAEEKYFSYELECLAIVKALKRFRVYLLGIEFKIVTDCRAFALTMKKKDICLRIARWAFYLEDFNYKIEHRPGRNMMHVDALSRNPLPTCLLIDDREDGLAAKLKKTQREDEDLKKIIENVENGAKTGYVMRGGVLYKGVDDDIRLVVPRSLCSTIIKRAHEKGHFSVAKTEAILVKDYWIPGLREKLEKIIRNCVDCIVAERKQGKQEGYLNAIAKGITPLDTFHIDHLGPLPSTKKSYKHILVVIDGFTKFTWLYATRSTTTLEVIDRLSKQAAIFGNPRRIISDRGTAFTAKEFEDYCKKEEIEHVLTTTGIPRANGQVERVNRTLIPLISKLAAPKVGEWFRYLSLAQQYLNTSFHRSIGSSPFQVMFGVRPRLREDVSLREMVEKEFITSFEEERDEIRCQAKERVQKIQEENKNSYNKKRKKARTYKEGDLVAIKRTQQGPGLKFASKFLGPYEISRVLRHDRYLVRKVGEHEGPQQTSTAADHVKPWVEYEDSEDDAGDVEEPHPRADEKFQDGRL
ncbi:uncharacterized protein LOC107220321 [Neodiprion lecontei]|uniref:RNA-directed DNA polymerase n=1 Tax=Neodiprion lecontei TaxID=441921 RepID=A0A6J0BHU9_NEOLC|nr:uncharacterized protein LOC107220321 [Neodiprion lecontei]